MNNSSAFAARKSPAASATPTGRVDPMDRLRSYLDTFRMKDNRGPQAFAEFERELHARVMELERDVIAAEMAQLDVNAEAILIKGKLHRRVLRRSQTYVTSA